MKVAKLDLLAGEHINEAAHKAVRLARERKSRVNMDFNGVALFATPKKSPVTICWEYNLISSQRSETYRQSKAGRKEKADREREVKSKQTAIDSWLLILPDALKSGHDNTIGWLSNFIPLSDDIGVKYDKSQFISLLESAGYKQDDCCGENKEFYANKDNLAKYIVGKVISLLRHCGAIHPGLERLCRDHESMRKNRLS